jgi:hypothetical protein
LGEGAGDRLVVPLSGPVKVAVVEVERLVVILHLRHVGLEEHVEEGRPFPEGPKPELAAVDDPAALERPLVFPHLRIADPRFGLDVVPPHVFGAAAVGPDVLAGDAAGVAPDALVEVEHHHQLGSRVHRLTSPTF